MTAGDLLNLTETYQIEFSAAFMLLWQNDKETTCCSQLGSIQALVQAIPDKQVQLPLFMHFKPSLLNDLSGSLVSLLDILV